MTDRMRYAVVGTGSRAGMYIEAIAKPYRQHAELVALCDISRTRMNWYNRWLQAHAGVGPRPTYLAAQFEQMIAETRPDVVIVASMDATHHRYIVMALDAGCDVITEKPITTDVDKLRAIFDALARTGGKLRVAFNYRYAPAYSRLRELMAAGTIGKPLLVDFAWMLDTSHGADYFRRWHREKNNSGGLFVHKATHHFDLVNWWINSTPQRVFAFGDLMFYGRENAEARGERYAYDRYTGVPEAAADPFALRLDENATLRGLYLEAEAETDYLRDRNVFGSPITIEDTMSLTAQYRNGVLLSYCLVAYAPWEGMRIAITGTSGRIELEVVETPTHLAPDTDAQASKGAFASAKLTVYPMFGTPYEVGLPATEGGHGGADPLLLEDLLSPAPRADPLNRAASHLDGAASVLMGFAANESMRTGRAIAVDDLFAIADPMRRMSPDNVPDAQP